MSQRKEHIVVDGQHVPVSNLDKVLFPKGQITKAQVIDYYLRISPYQRMNLPISRGEKLSPRPDPQETVTRRAPEEWFQEESGAGFFFISTSQSDFSRVECHLAT